jgi:hypothetical protein
VVKEMMAQIRRPKRGQLYGRTLRLHSDEIAVRMLCYAYSLGGDDNNRALMHLLCIPHVLRRARGFARRR